MLYNISLCMEVCSAGECKHLKNFSLVESAVKFMCLCMCVYVYTLIQFIHHKGITFVYALTQNFYVDTLDGC